MPATKKNRRRLIVDDRLFLWSLHDEDTNVLHVVSHDKRLNMRYGWQHSLPPHERYVDVMGPDFTGLPRGLDGWVRVRCPDFPGDTYAGSPRFVRQLILWALGPKPEVTYKQLPPGYSTHVLMASPWGTGLPTFSSSPGEPRTFRQVD